MPKNNLEDSVGKMKSKNSENLMVDVYTGIAEKTFTRSPYDPNTYVYPWNPDDLYQKAGDYSIYEDMLNDDQVSANMQIKKDLVLGSGHEIMTEDDGHNDIKTDLEIALNEDTEIPFEEQLEEVITSYDFGFSISEKLFQKRPDGTLSWKQFKTRHPNTWLIHIDDHGNIDKYEQQGTKINFFPDEKSLMHVVNNSRFQNPFGTSDLRAAHAAWFAKRQIIRFYAIFSEKAASPIPVARFNANAPDSAVTKIFNIIKKFQTKTAITIPKEIEVEFLEAKNNGEVYVKGINLFNTFIGRALLIPDLLGFTGEQSNRGGSQALGREQLKLFFLHIARRRKQLEFMVNKHVVKPLVVHNFGFIDSYPKFKLKPLDSEEIYTGAKLWLDATKSKLWKPNDEEINHLRNIANFPEGDVEREEPKPIIGQVPELDKDGNPMPPNPDDNLEPEKPDDKVDNNTDPNKVNNKGKKNFAKVFPEHIGDYYKKVDFALASNLMDVRVKKIENNARPIVNDIVDDLIDQIEKKKIIQKQDITRMDSINIKFKKRLQLAYKKNFKELFKEAQMMARGEIMRKDFAREPIPHDQFLEFLEKETFSAIGDWELELTRGAKTAVLDAMKNGKPLSEVIELIEGSREKSIVSVERWARTKTTEVFNRARKDFFESTGVIQGYQYSAILDGRTTPYCAGLHNKQFKLGEEPPIPGHFNCRSLLIPITIYEEIEPVEKIGRRSVGQFIEEEKGDGF